MRDGKVKSKPEHLLWVVVLAAAALFLALVFRPAPVGAPASRLNPVLYPLYPGIAWGTETAVTETGRSATQTTFPLPGYEIRSIAVRNITNIAAVTTPFENYYRQKLDEAGFTPVIYMEAGGPGASLEAYASGTEYVMIGYSTVFHSNVAGPTSPVACPCDTTLSIFSGSRKQ